MKFPDLPKAGASVAQSFKQIIDYLRASRIVSINGVQGQESTNGTVFSIPLSAAGTDTINYQPFEVILFKSAEIWKIRMIPGYVIARKNTTGECVALLEPTSLPTTAAPMTVETGDKVWIKVSESVNGIATAALVESGESWPTSLAAVLLGGNLGGTAGYKYYRIASFVASGEAIGDSLVKTQVITGHIDHFQPTLADNLISSASAGQARLMNQWNAANGRWDFRYLQAGDGIDITEDGDFILFEASHPWRVTDGGDGNANVNAGFLNGYYLYYSAGDPNVESADGILVPDSIVKGPASEYGGGTVAITGTKYIYAITPRGGAISEYAESAEIGDVTVGVELYDEINPTLGDSATIAASDSAPNGYTPASGFAAVCIAKVTNTEGVISVESQYVTSNPDIFLPVVNVCGNLAIM